MTVSGKLNGSRAGKVGEADYVFPLVIASRSRTSGHPQGNEQGPQQHQFGVGVGVGIR
jgi:outer membrane lipoprotein